MARPYQPTGIPPGHISVDSGRIRNSDTAWSVVAGDELSTRSDAVWSETTDGLRLTTRQLVTGALRLGVCSWLGAGC